MYSFNWPDGHWEYEGLTGRLKSIKEGPRKPRSVQFPGSRKDDRDARL